MGVTKRKRKAKPYQAEVYVSGVRVDTQCFETKAAACAWHDETKRRYEQGWGPIGEMTVADVIARYREVEFPSKVGPTRRRREMRFRLLEKAPIAKVAMRDFSGGTVTMLLDWLVKQDVARTPTRTSFLAELKALRVVLGFYRDYYDAKFVPPMTKWHRQRALFKGPLPKKAKDFFLPPDHARKWFGELARQRNPVFLDTAITQVVLGTRIGETCALCEDAVDFDRGTVIVKRTMEWMNEDSTKCRRIVERTKTADSRRELPLPPEIARIFKAALARQPAVLHKTSEGKLVRVIFHMPDGALMFDETVRAAYSRAFKQAGLPWSGSHICRDTNGTLGLKGASLEAVRVTLGHSSVVETEGYAKVHAMIENVIPGNVARLLFADNEKQNHVPVHVPRKSGA